MVQLRDEAFHIISQLDALNNRLLHLKSMYLHGVMVTMLM